MKSIEECDCLEINDLKIEILMRQKLIEHLDENYYCVCVYKEEIEKLHNILEQKQMQKELMS